MFLFVQEYALAAFTFAMQAGTKLAYVINFTEPFMLKHK